MLLSMTGYGAGEAERDGVRVAVEVRTVNNRYLKLHCRLPDGYGAFESRIEEAVRKQVRRGTVQLNVDVKRSGAADCTINAELVRAYYQQLAELQRELGTSQPISIESLLPLPGVIDDESQFGDAADDWPVIEEALKQALTGLMTMRQTEGAAMERDLTEQAVDIRTSATSIEALAPRVAKAYQNRLLERLNKMLAEHEVNVRPADIVREVGVFAERVDISEEIVRLSSHLEQFETVMRDAESGTGRKLEFLVQEILRETNTIGSKANDAEIATHVVHIKTCIERIREMVQNVE